MWYFKCLVSPISSERQFKERRRLMTLACSVRSHSGLAEFVFGAVQKAKLTSFKRRFCSKAHRQSPTTWDHSSKTVNHTFTPLTHSKIRPTPPPPAIYSLHPSEHRLLAAGEVRQFLWREDLKGMETWWRCECCAFILLFCWEQKLHGQNIEWI